MSQTQSAWIAFAEETLEQAESARRLRSYLQCFLTKCGFGLRNSEQRRKILIAYGFWWYLHVHANERPMSFPTVKAMKATTLWPNSLRRCRTWRAPCSSAAILSQVFLRRVCSAFGWLISVVLRSCFGHASVVLGAFDTWVWINTF